MKICFLYLALVLNLNFSLGQDKTPFDDFWKIGLTGMYVSHPASNNANGLNFEVGNVNSLSYGLKYNFYQFKSYNLSASLQHYKFAENYKYRLNAEDYPEDDVLFFHNTSQIKEIEHLTLNIMIDKYFPLQNHYFMLGIGPEIRLLKNFRGRSSTSYSYGNQIEDKIVFLETYSDSEKEWNFGLRADAGFGLASEIGLFEFRLHGHLGLNKFIKGTATVDNLLVSPSSTTDFSVSGNYYGMGLSYYPKRKASKNTN